MSYAHTKSRVLQYIGIILMIAVFAGAYWYFKVYAGYKTSVSPTGSITSGLVGYWTFDGADVSGTTAYDRSGSGNNGTLTNGPVATQGKVGQALDFDGTNDYVATTDYSFSNAQAFTMSVWFKADTVSGNQVIFSKATYEYNLRLTGSTLAFSYWDTGALNEIDLYSNVQANKWYQISVTYDGSGIAYMYVNGVQVDSDTDIVDAFQNKTDVFQIGGGYHISGSPGYLNGQIDEVRIYNRALSAGEIQSLYKLGQSDEVNTGASQAQGTGRLDSGLAGYWKMDDGTSGATPTTATDSSTNGNTLTLNSGPTWTTGQIGNAVNFDGSDDSATVGSGSTSVALTTDLSLSAWIYLDTTPSNGVMYEIMFKNSSGDASYLYRFSVYNNGSGSFLRFTPGGGGNHNESSTALTSGQWYHVMVTFDQPTLKFYLNGKLDTTASDSVGGGFASGSGTFRVGGAATAYFDGSIDEARIYNRALSADEVAQLYRLNTPTAVDTGLKGYWSFNGQDVSGTTAYDRSGAGNTGTLTNGPTVTPGKLGQALSFDSTNDYVDFGSPSSLDDLSTMTASAWIYPRSNGTNSVGVIFAKGPRYNPTSNGWVLRMNGPGSEALSFRSDFSTTDLERSSVSDFVPLNQWSHVVVTWDGTSTATNAHVYLNGVEVPYSTSTDGVGSHRSDAAESFIVGDGGGVLDSVFDGSIDEVRIYNRALAATEIESLYKLGQSDEVNTGASQAQGGSRLDSGLAGYWKLDDGSGTSATDASTNGNTGTLTNGPTWTTGQIGSAVDFDGNNDYIVLPSAFGDFGSTADFTLSSWFRNTNASADTDIIFNKEAGAADWINFGLNSSHQAGLYCATGGGNLYNEFSTTTYNDSLWHHLVASRSLSGTAVTIYVDGVAVKTSTGLTACTFSKNLSTSLGTYKIGAAHLFKGDIDEFRVYNRALSADEVAQLYRLNAPTGTETGLKGYWSFNGKDVSGTTAYDRSGAGNTGILTNGPTVTPGKIGQALRFDGVNDYVLGGTPAVTTYPITLSTWFKTTNAPSDYAQILMLGSGGLSLATLSETIAAECGGVGKIKYLIRDTTGTNSSNVCSSTVLNDGQWHHAVGVSSGASDHRLYIDGVLQNTSTTTIGTVTLGSTYIGANTGTQLFSGSIDEARIYNRALTESEIKALYNASR